MVGLIILKRAIGCRCHTVVDVLQSTALTSSSCPLVSGEGRSGAAHRKTSPRKQDSMLANGVTAVKPLCCARERL